MIAREQRMMDQRHNNGVTLVEILVVLGIIMALSGIVVTMTLRVDSQSKENATRSAFAVLGSALREYYEVRGQFPPQAERNPANALAHMTAMVQELRSVPAARQMLDKLDPSLVRGEGGLADAWSIRDPWGTVMDYIYIPGNTCPELISAGPDKLFGTGDDLSSKGKR
jgi:type II secretory pathway pseudopilin PulG